MNITDELTAFGIDAACCFAEKEFEIEKSKAQTDYLVFKLKEMVVEFLTGKSANSDSSEDGEEW